MNITACLAWYDETPATLHTCISSLSGVCDRVVAVDGRWNLFPGERLLSSEQERDAIFAAAREASMCAEIVSPEQPWASQVEKRSCLLRWAQECSYGDHPSDWLLVIDADEHVASCDREALEDALSAASQDVATVELTNLAARWPLSEMPPHTYTVRRLFRAAASPRYEVAHDGVRGQDGSWLSGHPKVGELAPAARISGETLALVHSVDCREPARRQQQMTYYRDRRRDLVEDWSAAA